MNIQKETDETEQEEKKLGKDRRKGNGTVDPPGGFALRASPWCGWAGKKNGRARVDARDPKPLSQMATDTQICMQNLMGSTI